jgi:hypothetical protein
MPERIISQSVVSERIIGGTGPFSSLSQKIKNLQGAFAAACLSPVLIILAFGLIYYSETFKKSSDIVKALPLETSAQVKDQTGPHKFAGVAAITLPLTAPKIGPVLYYDAASQLYKEVEETDRQTVTSTENGQQVEKVVETKKLVDKWVDTSDETKWAAYKVGDILVKPDNASLHFNFSSKEFRTSNGVETEVTTSSVEPVLGDTRLLLNYVPVETNLLIVGDISQNTVASGDTFIISNQTDAELTSTLQSGESTLYWIMKIGSWLLLLIGFASILKPLTAVLDFVPFFGGAINGVIGVVSAVAAGLLVLFGSLIIKFWWLCLISVFLTVGIAAFVIVTKSRKAK